MKKTIANINKAEWFLGKDGDACSLAAEREIKERTLAGTLEEVTKEYSPKFVILTLDGNTYGLPKSCLPYVEEVEIPDADYERGEALYLDGVKYIVWDTDDTRVMLSRGWHGKIYWWTRKFVAENMTREAAEATEIAETAEKTAEEPAEVSFAVPDEAIITDPEAMEAKYPGLAGKSDNDRLAMLVSMAVARYYKMLMEVCAPDGTGRESQKIIEDFRTTVVDAARRFDGSPLGLVRLAIGKSMAEGHIYRLRDIRTKECEDAIIGMWMLWRVVSKNRRLDFAVTPKAPTWYLSEVLYGMLDEDDAKQLNEWRASKFAKPLCFGKGKRIL